MQGHYMPQPQRLRVPSEQDLPRRRFEQYTHYHTLPSSCLYFFSVSFFHLPQTGQRPLTVSPWTSDRRYLNRLQYPESGASYSHPMPVHGQHHHTQKQNPNQRLQSPIQISSPGNQQEKAGS